MFLCDKGKATTQTKLAFFLAFKQCVWPFWPLFSTVWLFIEISSGNPVHNTKLNKCFVEQDLFIKIAVKNCRVGYVHFTNDFTSVQDLFVRNRMRNSNASLSSRPPLSILVVV